jgi:hypothetical protein
MRAARPGMWPRRGARRTGFAVLNRTRPEIKNGALVAPFLISGGMPSLLQSMLRSKINDTFRSGRI